MRYEGTSPKKKPDWVMRWSMVIAMGLYFFAAWATHGNYQSVRAFARIAPYFGALYLGVVCVRVAFLFGKDYPVQTALAVAAIALFGAAYIVAYWLALASLALVIVLAVTSARSAIRRMAYDLRESYRRISATTKQL